MEVQKLIEQLQELMEHSSMFPWPGRRAVSYDEFFRITEEIKRLLPEELAKATAIMEQRDRVLAEAAQQAREMIDRANEQSLSALENARRQVEKAVSREEVCRAAEVRAEQIIAQAEHEGQQIRLHADQYAADMLDRLAGFVGRVQQSIHDGRRSLADTMPQGRGAAPGGEPVDGP
jgi:hypothetical protein